MLNTAFYANWSTFWGGPRVGGKYNGPLTFAPFIGGVDRVIYGYLMFGIKPNPHLQLITTPGLFQGCKYVPMGTDEVPYVDSGDFDTYGMYPNYCWTGMAGNEWIQHDYRIDDDETFGQFAELKTLKSGLAVIASYGGWTWTHGGAQFSDLSGAKFHEMVTSQANIEAFVSSSLAYLKAKGFDGVDFDWEYPGQPTAASISPADAANDFIGFQNLITEYRKQAGSDFIITMQCSGFLSGDISIESLPGYPDKSMRNDSDYFTWIGSLIEAGLTNVNIMAYDYYTATSTPLATRPNAPIGCTGPTSIDSSNVAYKSLSGSERLGAETPTLDASYSLVSTQEVNNSDGSYKNDQLVGFSGGEQDSTCPVHYIVKPVDTFKSLAAQFGVTEEVLLAYNGFTAQTVIQAGETILQPPKPPAPACPNVDSTNLQVTGITDKTATDLANFFKIGAGEANIKILASMNPKAATDPSWPKLSQSTKYNMCGVSYTLTGSDNI